MTRTGSPCEILYGRYGQESSSSAPLLAPDSCHSHFAVALQCRHRVPALPRPVSFWSAAGRVPWTLPQMSASHPGRRGSDLPASLILGLEPRRPAARPDRAAPAADYPRASPAAPGSHACRVSDAPGFIPTSLFASVGPARSLASRAGAAAPAGGPEPDNYRVRPETPKTAPPCAISHAAPVSGRFRAILRGGGLSNSANPTTTPQ